MKKLVLVLAVLGIFLSNEIKAQKPSGYSVPIVTYKVDTTAYSNGLTVPAPFYFHVSSLSAEIDTSVGFFIQAYTFNTVDSLGTVKIINDSIPGRKIYPVSIPEVDTLTLDGMIELKIKQNLIDLYGINNVTKQ